jgi:soluble lytic murein transglycosylase-like protein
MFNVPQIQARLAGMSQQQLFQEGQANQNDALMFSLINNENMRRQKAKQAMMAQQAGQQQPPVKDQDLMAMAPTQALPEEQGIGALPAQNLQGMASGGITGFADGGLDSYAPQIFSEAKRLGIDPNIAFNLFKTESAGNKAATSGKGAAGLGQLMKPAAKEMGLSEEDRYDPQKNISASLGYFKKQLDRFGSYDKAAAAYNWGPGHLQEHLNKNDGILNINGLPKETAEYLTKLMPGKQVNAAELPTASAQAKQTTEPTQAEIDAASKPAFVTPSSGKGRQAGPISNALQSGQAQQQMVLGAGDLPYNLLGLPMDVGHQITKVFGNRTPDENIIGSSAYLKKKATELGIRTPTPTDPTLAGFREAGNIGASLVMPGGPSAGGVADLAAARAAQAARAQEAERIANTPRLPVSPSAGANLPPGSLVGEMGAEAKVGTPAQMLPRTAEDRALDSARTGEALSNLQKDQEIAAAQRAAADKLNAQEAPSTMRINPAGAASLAVNSGSAINAMMGADSTQTPASTPNYNAMTEEADREFGPRLQGTKETPSTGNIANTVTQTASGKGGRDYNDFLLNLGLGLMAGQSPYALQNLGTAGLGALKQEQEAKLQGLKERQVAAEERKAAAEEELGKQQGAYYGAYAEAIARGAKEKNTQLAVDQMIEKELSANKMLFDPAAREIERRKLQNMYYPQYGIASTMPIVGGGADPLGLRIGR